MSSNRLSLDVILSTIDKASAPLKKVMGGSQKTTQALKAAKDQLRALQRQQDDVSSFKKLKAAFEKSGATSREAGGEFKKAAAKAKELKQRLDATENPTKKMVREFEQARAAAKRLKDAHDEQRRKLHQLGNGLRQAKLDTTDLDKSQRLLAMRAKKATGEMERQQAQLKRLAQQQKRLAKARDAYQRGQSRAGTLAGVGAAGLATGGAALYSGARLLTPGVEYGEQMSAVQAVTRLNRDDPRFRALQNQARELGASTSFSATEVAGGQEFLARANFSPEAILASMRDILDLAKANRTELARAADISSNIGSAFKIDPEVEGNMRRVADVLTATATRANVNLEMLGETMKYLGQAEGLDLTLEQAAAMAGLLGNIGIQGSQAGTTLRAMLNRLAAPTGKAVDALKALDLQTADSAGNLRPIPAILADINRATAGMGNTQRAGYLKDIFGDEAGSGMAELIEKQGSAGVTKLANILNNVAGENARTAKVMGDNIGGDLKGLASAWQEVGITITDTNEGPLRELVQRITAITRAVGNWMKENPELTAQLATAAASIAALVAVGGALTLSLASVLGPIVAVRYGMTLLGVKGGGLATTLASLGKVTLPQLGGALVRLCGKLGSLRGQLGLLPAAWQASDPTPLLGGFKTLAERIKVLPGRFKQAGLQAQFLAGAAGSHLTKRLRDSAQAAWEFTTRPHLTKRLRESGKAAWEFATGPLVALRKRLKQAGLEAQFLAGATGSHLTKRLGDSAKAVWEFATGPLVALRKRLLAAAAAARAYVQANGLMGASLAVTKQGFAGLWGLLKGGFLGALGGAGTALRLVGQAVLFVGRALLLNPIGLAISAIAVAGLAIIKYWQPIKAFFGGFWQGLTEGLAPFREALAPLFETLGNALAPLKPIWDGLTGALAAAWEWVGKLFQPFEATGQEIDNATQAGYRFGQWLASLVNGVAELGGRFFEFGANLMGGLVDGIGSRIREVKERVLGVAGDVSNWFKDALGIHSPSRVFAQHGQDVLAGLQNGLADNKKTLAPVTDLSKRLKATAAGLAIGTAALPAAAAVQFDQRPPLQPIQQQQQPSGSLHIGEIHVHAAPGMDEQALARLVAREIERAAMKRQAAARGKLSDLE